METEPTPATPSPATMDSITERALERHLESDYFYNKYEKPADTRPVSDRATETETESETATETDTETDAETDAETETDTETDTETRSEVDGR